MAAARRYQGEGGHVAQTEESSGGNVVRTSTWLDAPTRLRTRWWPGGIDTDHSWRREVSEGEWFVNGGGWMQWRGGGKDGDIRRRCILLVWMPVRSKVHGVFCEASEKHIWRRLCISATFALGYRLPPSHHYTLGASSGPDTVFPLFRDNPHMVTAPRPAPFLFLALLVFMHQVLLHVLSSTRSPSAALGPLGTGHCRAARAGGPLH